MYGCAKGNLGGASWFMNFTCLEMEISEGNGVTFPVPALNQVTFFKAITKDGYGVTWVIKNSLFEQLMLTQECWMPLTRLNLQFGAMDSVTLKRSWDWNEPGTDLCVCVCSCLLFSPLPCRAKDVMSDPEAGVQKFSRHELVKEVVLLAWGDVNSVGHH